MVVVAVIVRALLFYNPSILSYFNQVLTRPHYIGWSQGSALRLKANTTLKTVRSEKKYLAVGSSQVHAIFNNSYFENLGGGGLTQAGMDALQIFLFEKKIKTTDAAYVFFYLSEFDLSEKIGFEKLKLADNHFLRYFYYAFLLRDSFANAGALTFFVEAFLSDVFPEYKYRFILQGYLRKSTHSFLGFEPKLRTSVMEEKAKRNHLFGLWNHGIQYHDAHINILDVALGRLQKAMPQARIFILAGDYHKDGSNDKSIYLRQIVNDRLRKLTEGFERVFYIPRNELYVLQPEDYRDLTHVNAEGAEKYLRSLMKYMQENEYH